MNINEKVALGQRMEKHKPVKTKVTEAINLLTMLKSFSNLNIEEIRKIITEANLKTLEDETETAVGLLDLFRPGLCTKYNTLIERLKNPNLIFKDFLEIIEEAKKLKDW